MSRIGKLVMIGGRPCGATFLALAVIAIVGILTFVYARPVSIADKFLPGTLAFFDGIHRLVSGQVPHVDFSTPVGALAYWLPQQGYRAMGGYGGAIETASLFLAAVVVPFAAILLWRRANAWIALMVLGTIAAIIVVPTVPGRPYDEISHAMHYNRWSWGVITALFLLGLPPVATNDRLLRGSIGAVLCAALFFIKITYFIFGAAFLLLLLICNDRRRGEAVLALAGVLLLLATSFVLSSGMFLEYVADIRQALDANGGVVRGSFLSIVLSTQTSLLPLLLAIYLGLMTQTIRWYEFLLVVFIAAAGVVIIDQNFQFTFIVCLPAAFALLAAPRDPEREATLVAKSGIAAVCMVMLLPDVADWGRVTLQHLGGPQERHSTLDVEGFEGFYVANWLPVDPAAASPASGPTDAASYLRGETPIAALSEVQYLTALEDGVTLMRDAGVNDASTFTIDSSNTLALLADAPRVRNGFSWIHFGRNISMEAMPEGDEIFAEIDYLMAPLRAHNPTLAAELIDLYGPYLAGRAKEIARSDYWILFLIK